MDDCRDNRKQGSHKVTMTHTPPPIIESLTSPSIELPTSGFFLVFFPFYCKLAYINTAKVWDAMALLIMDNNSAPE